MAKLFADDTSLSYSSNDSSEIDSMLNHDLHIILQWSKTWHVTFNPSKTDVVLFNGNLPPLDLNLLFDNTLLNVSKTHKHLGVTLSSNCKWSDHVENICLSVAKHLSVLRKMKFILDRQTLSKLYCVFIRPLLEYACELWDGCSRFDTDKLEKLQLEAARIVTGLPCYASRQSLYFETG